MVSLRAWEGPIVTITLSTSASIYTNDVSVSGEPAFDLTGDGIRFVNIDRGRALAANNSTAAIQISGLGGTIENEADGVVRSYDGWYNYLAISGGLGNDVLINRGTVQGTVALGDGDDRIEHYGAVNWSTVFELGAGNDRLSITPPNATSNTTLYASGGSGTDTLDLNGQFSTLYGNAITGFETLNISAPYNGFSGYANNLISFSGYSSISIANNSVANFIQSINPLVDLTISGGSTGISNGSVFRNVQGSDATEFVSINKDGFVTNTINLAGGDDTLFISTLADFYRPGASVQGGQGKDSIILITDNSFDAVRADYVFDFDMRNYAGFEELRDGGNPRTTDLIIRNANGLQAIDFTYRDLISIVDSVSPDAYVNAVRGNLNISSGSVIGRYGFGPGSMSHSDLSAVTTVDLGSNTTIANNGTILGNVQLYFGDDVYNGSTGTTGGTIYGYAGNDILIGGLTDDRINGGYGADDLTGNAGNDILVGEAGNDRLSGGLGIDTLQGDGGYDYLDGGASGDSLNGGEGFDYAVYSSATQGLIIDLQFAASQNIGEAAGDTYVSIEGVLGTDFADSLRGDQNANWIYGNGGDDYLFGRAGGDVLLGGAGNDTLLGEDGIDSLFGGIGNDYLIGGAGSDSLTGDAGFDYALYEYASTGIIADLQFALSQNTGEASGDTYTDVEGLVGSAANDSLRGDATGNWLWGGLGDDIIYGRDGNDVIVGGRGSDILVGGDGNDLFQFGINDGKDVIYDMAAGNGAGDVVRVSTALGVSSYAQLQSIASQVGAHTIFTFDDATTLTFLNTDRFALAVDDFVFI